MKTKITALVLLLLLPFAALAQTYPNNGATYIPTASTNPTTCTTASASNSPPPPI